jgi:hypothetical protein
MSTGIQINSGSDATLTVRWPAVGDLSAHTFQLLDIGARLNGRLSAVFDEYIAAAGDDPEVSVLLVLFEGTDPIPPGLASFRLQATLDGVSVSTGLVRVEIV